VILETVLVAYLVTLKPTPAVYVSAAVTESARKRLVQRTEPPRRRPVKRDAP